MIISLFVCLTVFLYECVCIQMYVSTCFHICMSWFTLSQLYSAYCVHFCYVYLRMFASNVRFYSVRILSIILNEY